MVHRYHYIRPYASYIHSPIGQSNSKFSGTNLSSHLAVHIFMYVRNNHYHGATSHLQLNILLLLLLLLLD